MKFKFEYLEETWISIFSLLFDLQSFITRAFQQHKRTQFNRLKWSKKINSFGLLHHLFKSGYDRQFQTSVSLTKNLSVNCSLEKTKNSYGRQVIRSRLTNLMCLREKTFCSKWFTKFRICRMVTECGQTNIS